MSKRRIGLCISAFLVAFIMVMAVLWTPQVAKEVYSDEKKLIHTWGASDVVQTNSCMVTEEGVVEITGGDAFVIFPEISESGQLIKIYFAKPLEDNVLLEVYINADWGFSEARKVRHQCEKGDTSVELEVTEDFYKQIRLDMDIPYQLDRIEMYQYKVVTRDVNTSPLWYLWATGIGLIAAVAMFFLDKKIYVADFCVKKIQLVFKKFREKFFLIVVLGVLSIVISLVLTGIPNLLMFELYKFGVTVITTFAFLCSMACIWSYRNDLVANFEKVFVITLLLIGMTMIVLTPIGHAAWDTDVHYRLALETSYWGDAKLTQADLMVTKVHTAAIVTNSSENNFRNMEILASNYTEVVESYETGISISHIPSALFIALSRLIGLPFPLIFMSGKFANLLLYTFLCYYGLKRLKSGKLIFAVIALIPTSVYLACSYSYDCWVTGFSLLGMAYFIGNLQEHDKIVSTKDTIIMCGAMGIACYPKQIYFPIMLLPFIMPKKKMEKTKKYYILCFLALAAMLLLFIGTAFAETTGTGDTRGEGNISPMGQVMFILTHIIEYAVILLKFLFTDYLTIANTHNYISNFVYLGMGATTFNVLILALIAFLFDKDKPYTKETQTGWRTRSYVLLMYFGGSALIATALYVAFTAVGSPTIQGCQPRYIIPWLYPLLSVWSMNKIKPVVEKYHLYWFITLGAFGVLFYNIFTVFLPIATAI